MKLEELYSYELKEFSASYDDFEKRNKVSVCGSENSCELVENYLSGKIDEKLIFSNIEKIRQEVEEKMMILTDIKIYTIELENDILYLQKSINNYYEEVHPGWNKR